MGGYHGVHHLLLDLALDCILELASHVLANFLAKLLFATFFNTVLGEQFLVHLGRRHFFDGIHLDLELHRRALQFLIVVVLGETQLQRLFIARFHTHDSVLESWNHTARTQFQIRALGAPAFKGLAITRAGVINIDLVAFCRSPLDRLPAALLLAKHLDNVIDVLGGHLGNRFGDIEVLDLKHFYFRKDLERGDVLKVFTRVQRPGLDTGLTCGTQLLLHHCFLEGLTHHLAQHFLTHAGAKALAQDLHGHLAWSETRQTNVLGGLFQALVHFTVYACRGYANGQTTLQTGSRLNRNLHGISSSMTRWRVP